MPEKPDYIRIADEITADVTAGRLRPGDRLPSITKMAAQYGVHVSTIKMVYVRLEALEVIRRHQGKGVFIAE